MRQNRHRSFIRDGQKITVLAHRHRHRPPTAEPKAHRPDAPDARLARPPLRAQTDRARGEDRLDAPVRWAHASELADPVPYMEGGELLLITALKLDAEDRDAMRRYVKRLVGAGVVGLGFAVGVHYDDIPEALVEAAREEGLPLLEVPRRTPFLAISKAVSAAIAADQYRAVTAASPPSGNSPGTPSPTVPRGCSPRSPPRSTGGPRCTTPPGRSSPPPPTGRAGAPPGSPRRSHGCGSGPRPPPRSSPDRRTRTGSSCTPRHRTAPPRRARRRHRVRARHRRALRRPLRRRAAHPHHRTLPLAARGRAAHRRGRAAHAARGEPDHARAVAGDLYGGLLDAPFRIIVAQGAAEGDALGALAEAAESAAARSGRPCWWCRRGAGGRAGGGRWRRRRRLLRCRCRAGGRAEGG